MTDVLTDLANGLVSVPLWGLFNLTKILKVTYYTAIGSQFPSPYGDYLI